MQDLDSTGGSPVEGRFPVGLCNLHGPMGAADLRYPVQEGQERGRGRPEGAEFLRDRPRGLEPAETKGDPVLVQIPDEADRVQDLRAASPLCMGWRSVHASSRFRGALSLQCATVHGVNGTPRPHAARPRGIRQMPTFTANLPVRIETPANRFSFVGVTRDGHDQSARKDPPSPKSPVE